MTSKIKFTKMMLQAQKDPIYFMTDILEVDEIFPKQEEIIRNFYRFKYEGGLPDYNELILCAGMRSIWEDSLILTRSGVKKAKNVLSTDYLWDGCEWHRPVQRFDNYDKDSVKIRTQYGITLRCSKEHRVWTQDGFKEAQNLTTEDKLRLDLIPIYGGDDRLPQTDIIYNGNKACTYPKLMTVDLAKILGFLIAEGTCNVETRCDFTNGDEDIRELFKSLIYNTFNIKDCITENDITLSVNHSGIGRFIHSLGIGNVNAYTKEVPHVIFQSLPYYRRAFLSAYFEGDGTVCLEKSGKKAVVRAYTVSENLALQIQQLLLMDGILSSISTQKSRDYGTGGKRRENNIYVISITGNFIKEYYEKIGFISNRKNAELKRCVEWVKSRKCRKIKDTYWLKIKSVEENGIIPMVDFKMPNLNMYLANGVLVHNSGKTLLFGLIGAYEFFDCITKTDPARYYGLAKNQLVSLGCAAASEKQANDGIFYNIKTNLKFCDFINDNWDVEYRADRIVCNDRNVLFRVLSSNVSTSVGRSHKTIIYDELDLFEQNEGTTGAWNYYNRMNKSTITFKEYGFSFATSSPITTNGIILTLARRAMETDRDGNLIRKKTLSYIIPTWEFNPHFIFEELAEPYKHNMDTFWRDFGCDPSAASSLQFPLGVTLDKKIPNILADIQNVPQQNHPHIMAIDPAIKSDSFGVAVGYYDYGNDKVVIDGVTSFVPDSGSVLSASEIKHKLVHIIKKTKSYVLLFDIYMFPEILEYAEKNLGMEVIQHIVTKDDYDRVREGMESGFLDITFNEYLKFELENLEIKKLSRLYRVDHPPGGSKDMSDCVANVVYYLRELCGFGDIQVPFVGIGGFV